MIIVKNSCGETVKHLKTDLIMKVNDILQITEYGTTLRIFDSQTVETAVEGMMLRDNYDKFAKYGDKTVLAINTNDETLNFELVVK